jgi:hypothetical protein
MTKKKKCKVKNCKRGYHARSLCRLHYWREVRKEPSATKSDGQRILLIPDLHAPYHHPDALKFLAAVNKKYNPNKIINLGDMEDNHAISFHDSDADLPSAGDELKKVIKFAKQLEKLFPEMVIVDSNHGSLALRRFKHHGIPMKLLRDIKEIYNTPKWEWHNDYTIKLTNGTDLYVVHGVSKNGLKLTQQRGVNSAQGHYHTEFRIDYASNPANLLFSVQVGCLIDKKSMAFSYDKLNLQRPILGCAVIIDSIPQLIPMVLNKSGRWIGKL